MIGASGYYHSQHSELSLCVECGESFVFEVGEGQHASWCSKRPGAAGQSSRRAVRTSPDPNSYVWTARGFEREIDVERRRSKQQ